MILALPGAEAFQCDVSNDAEIDNLFAQIKERYGKLARFSAQRGLRSCRGT